MIRKVVSVAVLLYGMGVYAQVGIGTISPDNSALLDLQSNSDKGLLIPRVNLTDLTNSTTFGDNGAAESLLVYNKMQTGDILAGFYYWDGSNWIIFMTEKNFNTEDLNDTTNADFSIEIDPKTNKESLTITDSQTNKIFLPLEDIAINDSFINSLINNNTFTDTFFNVMQTKAKTLTSGEKTITISGNSQLLNDTEIDVANYSLKPEKFNTEGSTIGMVLAIDKSGKASYQAINPSQIADKGKLASSEGTISISGTNEILSNTTIDVSDHSIVVRKLNSIGALNNSILTADGNGNAAYQKLNASMITDGGNISTDGVVTVDDGSKKVLSNVKLGIAEKSIEINKLSSGNAAINQVAVTNSTGGLTYKLLGPEDIHDRKDIISSNKSITISNGNASVLSSKNLDLDIANFAVITDKIAPSSVTAGKLTAGSTPDLNDRIPIAAPDGSVTYQPVSKFQNKGSRLAVSNSLKITDSSNNTLASNNALLEPLTISINNNGILNNHIQALAVTTDKISSNQTTANDMVLTSDGKGATTFRSANDIIVAESKKSIIGNDQIVVKGGDNVLIGENGTNNLNSVKLSINPGSINTEHLTGSSVKRDIIANMEVTADKLNAGFAPNNNSIPRYAIADDLGNVTYGPLDLSNYQASGDIFNTEDIIEIEQEKNTHPVFSNVRLGINQQSIPLKKLNAKNEAVGNVIMVMKGDATKANIDGTLQNYLSYQPITPDLISLKGTLSTDDIIQIVNQDTTTDGSNALLKDLSLKIGDNSITQNQMDENSIGTDQLIDKSVTANKIANKTITAGQIKDKTITTGQIADKTITAGQIKDKTITAGQIADKTITAGQIEDKTITTTQIADNAISNSQIQPNAVTVDKIGSKVGEDKYVLISNGAGGASWLPQETVQVTGKDLTSTDQSIEISNGTGLVLLQSSINIAPGGVNNTHIAKNTVDNTQMTSKISSTEDVQQNQVLTADGGGNVMWSSISGAIVGGEDLTLGPGLEFTSNSLSIGISSVLNAMQIGIAENGITSKEIKDAAIGTNHLHSDNAEKKGDIMVAGANNTVEWVSPSEVRGFGEPLTLSNALTFTDNTNGEHLLFNPASLDINKAGVTNEKIATQAVTVDKISSIIGSTQAGKNSVLVSDGSKSTTFTDISNLLTGQGKTLSSTNNSITISGNNSNKVLLSDAAIDIAPNGVRNNNLANQNVTADKLVAKNKFADSSILGVNNTLTTNNDGSVSYSSFSSVFNNNLSGDNSIALTSGTTSNTSLSPMVIKVAEKGIKNTHLADKAVTTTKISSDGLLPGFVLVSDGNNTVKYSTIKDIYTVPAKNLTVTGGLTIDSPNDKGIGATLKDLNITIADKGINNEKIADNTITTTKLNTSNATSGYVLMVQDDHTAAYTSMSAVGSDVSSSDGSIKLLNYEQAALKPLSIEVAEDGIKNNHIDTGAVTADKIGTKIDDTNNIAPGLVLTSTGFGTAEFLEVKSAISLPDYTSTPTITGQKWLNTNYNVVQQVFTITTTTPSNSITLKGVQINNTIISARLIQDGGSAITTGLVQKQVVGNDTIFYFGTPGFLSATQPAAKYYLILEYLD